MHLEKLFALINLGPFRLTRHLAAPQSDEGGSFFSDGRSILSNLFRVNLRNSRIDLRFHEIREIPSKIANFGLRFLFPRLYP
ncbi:MAG TPA: hypothetical protein VNV43_05180, partial [Candidatus Acidoferrales bacterium]|nr:hypothetical protein [Candidatus Acidoferrales bacterium]